MFDRPRVLITRSRRQSGELAAEIRKIGAEPVFLPTIEIKPVADTPQLDLCLSKIGSFDWLVLTSANAVEVFFGRLDDLDIDLPTGELDIAVIGPKTAEALKSRGVTYTFMPSEFVTEAVLPGLGDLRGKRVLIPTADIARDTLPDAIRQAGGEVEKVTIYSTIPAAPDEDGLASLREGVDVITFTSGSTVRNFFLMVEQAGMDPCDLPGGPKIACIGPKTAAEARRIGLEVHIQAQTYTIQGLVEAIQGKLNRDKVL